MSAKQQLAEAIATLPESTSLEEAFERLYAAFKEKLRREAALSSTLPDISILHTPDVCGGSARVGNTRIPVWSLVQARRLGISDEQLLRNYPSLMPSHLQAAWKYYESHRQEIERDIAEQDEE